MKFLCKTFPRRPRPSSKCVAYSLCIISRSLLLTGLNSSLSLRSSAIVVLTGPAVMLVIAAYWSMNVLRSSVSVSTLQKKKSSSLTNGVLSTDTGAQPIVSDDGKLILAVNGEIYNHIKLRAACGSGYKFKTHSDCEVVIPLVRGVCADTANQEYNVAR